MTHIYIFRRCMHLSRPSCPDAGYVSLPCPTFWFTFVPSLIAHQRLANPETLSLEEGEDHAPSEKDHVAFLDKRLDHSDLWGSIIRPNDLQFRASGVTIAFTELAFRNKYAVKMQARQITETSYNTTFQIYQRICAPIRLCPATKVRLSVQIHSHPPTNLRYFQYESGAHTQ